MTTVDAPNERSKVMDLLLTSAYVLVGVYVGFVVGLFVRGSFVERRPPDGGESPSPSPTGLGPDDWTMWEGELGDPQPVRDRSMGGASP
jgi:hypothetical protein